MVTVTGQADDVFVVEVVQLLSEEEAKQAKQSLTKLLRFAVDLHSTTLKRSAPWTADDSPVKAKTCKELGRCASGPAMEDMPYLRTSRQHPCIALETHVA